MTKFFSFLSYLISVLATLKHEPRIIRQALFDSKGPVLPKKYWRKEVLKPLFGDEFDDFPNAIRNHFCPLFWVSNFFPIIWLVVAVFKAADKTLTMASFIISKIKSSFKEKQNKVSVQQIERSLPSIAYDFYQELKTPIEEGEDWKTYWDTTSVSLDRARRIFFNGEDSALPLSTRTQQYTILLQKVEGDIEKIKELASQYAAQKDAKLKEFKDEPKKEKKKFDVAKWTNVSHTFFKYFLIILPCILGIWLLFEAVANIGLIFKFFGYCFDAMVWAVMGLLHIPFSPAFWLLVVSVVFGVGLTALMKKVAEEEHPLLEANVEKLVNGTIKVWDIIIWPFCKCWAGLVFIKDLAKMTYHNNCPPNNWEE